MKYWMEETIDRVLKFLKLRKKLNRIEFEPVLSEESEYDYYSRSERIFYSCMQMVKEFVENENMGQADWDFCQEYRNAKNKILELYNWYVKDYPVLCRDIENLISKLEMPEFRHVGNGKVKIEYKNEKHKQFNRSVNNEIHELDEKLYEEKKEAMKSVADVIYYLDD